MALVCDLDLEFTVPQICVTCARPINKLSELKWVTRCATHAYHRDCLLARNCINCQGAAPKEVRTLANGCILCNPLGNARHHGTHSSLACYNALLVELCANIGDIIQPILADRLVLQHVDPSLVHFADPEHPLTRLLCDNVSRYLCNTQPAGSILVRVAEGLLVCSTWVSVLRQITERVSKERMLSLDEVDYTCLYHQRTFASDNEREMADRISRIRLVSLINSCQIRGYIVRNGTIYQKNSYGVYDIETFRAWLSDHVPLQGLSDGCSALLPDSMYAIHPHMARWLQDLRDEEFIVVLPGHTGIDQIIFLCDTPRRRRPMALSLHW